MNQKFEVKFDVLPKSIPSASYASVIHLTVANNEANHGDRIPAVWLNSQSFWLVASSVSGNRNHNHAFWNLCLNTWNSFRIWQTQIPDGSYFFEYSINNKTIHSIENNDPKLFRNVKVYAADPWYVSADAKIRNFQICT